MDYNTIEVSADGPVAVVALNRPDRMNAWTYEMGDELRAALRAANDDDTAEAIVVTGNGRGFCAGADIRDTFQSQADGGDRAGSRDHTDWVELVRSSKPIVAAVNGAAIGVGLSQILPMDFIVAAEGAKLSCRFIKMGVVPELASSHFMVARCGFGAASELMLSGRIIEADEALRIGLVDRVVGPDDLLAAATEVAAAMGNNPQAALRLVKSLVTQNMAETDLGEVQRRELKALSKSYESPEHHEAIAAFMERREPDFRAARLSGTANTDGS